MLGWEFPPHISGGLGTACQGICEGLSSAGVEVTFVVPRRMGGEHARGTRVVGANNPSAPAPARQRPAELSLPLVPLDWVEAPTAGRAKDLADPGPLPGTPLADAPPGTGTAGRRSILIDSPLSPYQTARTYRQTFQPGFGKLTVHGAKRGPGEPAGKAPAPPLLGGYGEHLFDEIQRYGEIVADLAQHESFDLVHGHDWMTAPAAIAAARRADRPLVMHAHALERDRSGDHPDHRIVTLERNGLRNADRAICVSEFTRQQVHQQYGVPEERLRVLHNAVTPATSASTRLGSAPAAGEPGPTVLFLGRVTMQKGPEYFLRAAARVIQHRPDARFVLSGSGDLLPGMIELSASLGLGGHVSFTGFLRGTDVQHMYSQANLYVMPSVSEPFGIAPLEAMVQGVPVIVSKQSGVSEVVEHALKVDFWDVDELANKILAAISYPALAAALSEHGREEASSMSWNSRGVSLERIYREIVA